VTFDVEGMDVVHQVCQLEVSEDPGKLEVVNYGFVDVEGDGLAVDSCLDGGKKEGIGDVEQDFAELDSSAEMDIDH